MLHKLLCGVLLCASSPAIPQAVVAPTTTALTMPSPFRGSFATVPRLDCGDVRGSGVRISDDIILTARHVVQNENTETFRTCYAYGQATETVALGDKGLDFAAVRMPARDGLRAIISCEGVKPGERYYAYGYAFGLDPNMEPLIGTDEVARDGRVHLRGRIFPGMSGGAVSNSEGAVVAIIVQYNDRLDHSIVVPLTKTYLCQREKD